MLSFLQEQEPGGALESIGEDTQEHSAPETNQRPDSEGQEQQYL